MNGGHKIQVILSTSEITMFIYIKLFLLLLRTSVKYTFRNVFVQISAFASGNNITNTAVKGAY